MALALAALLLLALPAIASAADTYADASAVDNSGDCLSPQTACRTIGGVDGALAKSGSGETTFVAAGAYAESIVLEDGKSLVAADPDDQPVIDNGTASNPAVAVDSGGAGSVDGLTIRSDFQPLQIEGTVTVVNSTFDEDHAPTSTGSDIEIDGGASVLVMGNTFIDPDPSDDQTAVAATGAIAPAITSNSFSDFATAIEASSDGATISDNQISGVHSQAGSPGVGIKAVGGDPDISTNAISAAGTGPSIGILIQDQATSGGIELNRNVVSGEDVGVRISGATVPVELSDHLIYDNTTGLEAVNSSAAGEARVIGSTFDDTSTDISLDGSPLTLSSSILEQPISLVGGSESCTISYSRGDPAPVDNGCDDFDSFTNPQFVDRSAHDYHLQAVSPMIDAGDPAAPPSGDFDFYGNPRAVQGLPCDPVRRDIGAAEYQPSSQPLCAQPTYADPSASNDNDDCISPASACKTGAAALSKSASGQTTYLAAGTYGESLTLSGGRSLAPLAPSGPMPFVNAPSGQTAITVPSGGAGSISGLKIRSNHLGLGLDGAVTVDRNLIDPPSPGDETNVQVSGSGVRITNNQIDDPDASGAQVGVASTGSDTVISGNTFTHLAAGVEALGGQPQISGNQFSGAHPLGPTSFGTLPGAGVLVIDANPTISANTFSAPAARPAAGVYLRSGSGGAGATIDHNRISGQDAGVQVIDTDLPISLSNDLLYDNTVGLSATDTSADSPPSSQGNVTAVNETFSNDVDVQLSYTRLTLDSSILLSPIDLVGSNGSCLISYSRGPAGGSINGCGNFTSTADPQFANAAGGDYRLQTSSPLIDLGNPAAPGSGATDFYGSARAVQGKDCSSVRRDIGAAEYIPMATPSCPQPPVQPPAAPAQPEAPSRPAVSRHPDRRSDDDSPTFGFSSDVAGSSFRCKLDGGPYRRCRSPKTYRGLDPGKHVFRVYAVSPSAEKGRPKVFRFTVLPGG